VPYTLPVAVLVSLGTIIAVLGLFAAGDITVIAVGLVAIVAAGALEVVAERRTA
jgi:hypothetical protein